jgi:rfaE bifunctional protein kinase chain/domain
VTAHRNSQPRASRAALRVEPTPALRTLPKTEKRERQRPHPLGQIIDAFAHQRVLVIGDMVADEYIIGAPTRISREAPIPVIAQREHFTVPGGALNPAVNARELGAEVHVLGLIGDDEPGRRLRHRLAEKGIHQDLLFTEAHRPTSTKLRILATNNQGMMQHVARVDTIDTASPGDATIARALDGLERLMPAIDAIIFSDYDSGFMAPEIIATALRLGAEHGCITVADAHLGLRRYRGVTALTPNQSEAEVEADITISDHGSLERVGRLLLDEVQARGVLITRGSEGMAIFERDRFTLDIPAYPTEVRDTIGAGDTVTATFALGLATGAALADAALIANVAAGLVVRRLGCATTSPEELHLALSGLQPTW